MMHEYTAIHQDSNLSRLAGLSRATLMKEYYEQSTAEQPMTVGGTCHRDIVRMILACGDDLVLEGFFRKYVHDSDENKNGHVEVCIFSSESLRQIIVCFRGGLMNKAKLQLKQGKNEARHALKRFGYMTNDLASA